MIGPTPGAPAALPPQGGAASGPAEPVPRRLLGRGLRAAAQWCTVEMLGTVPVASPASVQTLLSFDYGQRRVGVAVGNTLLRRAQALTTIAAEGDARFGVLQALIKEWQPSALVVGMPFHPDGAEHDSTLRARRFARQLRGRFRLPVHEVDERYSTTAALEDGAADADAAAAAIILDQFFRDPPADDAPA